jgi:hypothetical protein
VLVRREAALRCRRTGCKVSGTKRTPINVRTDQIMRM